MQILQLLQRLTNALGPNCVVMAQFVLGLLDYSLNIEGPEALSLVEDALLLWLVTLRNVPADARESLRLWPHWVTIMGTSIEHVQSCMMVASSAVLLGQAEFLQVRTVNTHCELGAWGGSGRVEADTHHINDSRQWSMPSQHSNSQPWLPVHSRPIEISKQRQ